MSIHSSDFFSGVLPSVCFSGYSGSGKTTLAEQFIRFLVNQGYRPGYLKHAGHVHTFDKPGKDTFKASAAGSVVSAVYTAQDYAVYGNGSLQPETFISVKPAFDILVAEGFKNDEGLPFKVAVEHPQKGFPDISNAICFVFRNNPPQSKSNIPAFNVNETEKLNQFLLAHILESTRQKIPLDAAVLIGGKSSRMNKDKYCLNYHGIPEFERLFNLLNEHPNIRQTRFFGKFEQMEKSTLIDKRMTVDQFSGFGPYNGILTALHYFQNSAVLVIGCDYPGLTEKTINKLIQHRHPLKSATLFLNKQGLIETTCGIYEPLARYLIHARIGETGNIKNRDIKSWSPCFIDATPLDDVELTNVNTPDDMQTFLNKKPKI